MPEHQTVVYELFGEYLHWVCARIYQEYDVIFEPQAVLRQDMADIHIFLPPTGSLLLAYEGGSPAGCVCTRSIGKRIAELKRMHVRPEFRGKGIGTKLVQESIRWARSMNFATLRLDSAGFMSDAHRLYHSQGFHDIPAYPESEIPQEYQKHWIFMQLILE
jgi:GNAT superfamily N-acetyltransferase